MYEVLVIGAGPAGLSAALILGRCRRRVLVCDSGRPRNAVTPALHAYLTREGLPPSELRRLGRAELAPYDSVEVRDVTVVDAVAGGDGFVATLDNGDSVRARKLLIATGVVDVLPPVAGLQELYGRTVFHCAYCDGWEIRDRPIAIYGRGRSAIAEARALSRYTSDMVICTDGDPDIAPADVAGLARLGIVFASKRVARLEPREHGLAVVFADGTFIERGSLFFCSALHVRSRLAERLGCEFASNGLVETRENEASGVSGVYVAGDASRSVLLAIVAAAEGAAAAFAINRELLREDLGN